MSISRNENCITTKRRILLFSLAHSYNEIESSNNFYAYTCLVRTAINIPYQLSLYLNFIRILMNLWDDDLNLIEFR